jgi:ligand-binding sensor domain-containing protein
MRYGMEYNLIYTITEDREGTLWLGTDRGVYYFNPDKQPFFSLSLPEGKQKGEAAVVTGFLESTDKNIWVISLTRGLSVYNPQFQLLKQYPASNDTRSLLHSVWNVVEDSRGSIWAACDGGYLARIRPHTELVEYMRPSAFRGQTIVKGALDPDGSIWWGTDQGLLIRHTPATGQFVGLPLLDTSAVKKGGKIKRILPQKAEVVWVATARGGIL